MALGMVFQTMYYLVDLYFVAKLGDDAVAGVSAVGNVQFIVLALSQILGVGTMVLLSHAAGRKDSERATRVFNQSLVISALLGGLVLLLGYAGGDAYARAVAATPAATAAGISYLRWYLPALGAQFALISLGSALRGAGIAKPTMIVQMLSVVLNVILAPVLIAGWGTGRPLGVAGAGLASSVSVIAGVLMLWSYYGKLRHFVRTDRAQLRRIDWTIWKDMLKVGLPAGGEFALMFVYSAVVYSIIRGFGAEAQAGFGLGTRVMQAIFLPSMAIAFAAAPVAGQNFGAGFYDRTRQTFRTAALMGSAVMLLVTLVTQLEAGSFIRVFSQEAPVVAVGEQYLSIISFNFIAQGLIFTCSGMFQALGNTIPSLLSSSIRMVSFVFPVLWIAKRPGFALQQVWYLSIATALLQLLCSLLLLRREMSRRLPAGPPNAVPSPAVA
jgi:putative MATE family efflux protein